MTNPPRSQDSTFSRAQSGAAPEEAQGSRFPGSRPARPAGGVDASAGSVGDRRIARPVRSGAGRLGRPPLRQLPLYAGLAVFLLGLLFTLAMPTKYTSSVNLAVIPGTATPAQAASLFDTLSRGQIVATASEIYSQPRWTAGHPGVTLSAGGVTPSAVMTVTAVGSDRSAVASTLTGVMSAATPTVNRAIAPYRVMSLTPGTPTVAATGVGKSTLLVLSLIAGLIAAALVATLLRLLARTRHDG